MVRNQTLVVTYLITLSLLVIAVGIKNHSSVRKVSKSDFNVIYYVPMTSDSAFHVNFIRMII